MYASRALRSAVAACAILTLAACGPAGPEPTSPPATTDVTSAPEATGPAEPATSEPATTDPATTPPEETSAPTETTEPTEPVEPAPDAAALLTAWLAEDTCPSPTDMSAMTGLTLDTVDANTEAISSDPSVLTDTLRCQYSAGTFMEDDFTQQSVVIYIMRGSAEIPWTEPGAPPSEPGGPATESTPAPEFGEWAWYMRFPNPKRSDFWNECGLHVYTELPDTNAGGVFVVTDPGNTDMDGMCAAARGIFTSVG